MPAAPSTAIRRTGRLLVTAAVVVASSSAPPGCCRACFGYERYVITGGSMSGTFEKGSVAFEKQVPVADLERRRRHHLPAAGRLRRDRPGHPPDHGHRAGRGRRRALPHPGRRQPRPRPVALRAHRGHPAGGRAHRPARRLTRSSRWPTATPGCCSSAAPPRLIALLALVELTSGSAVASPDGRAGAASRSAARRRRPPPSIPGQACGPPVAVRPDETRLPRRSPTACTPPPRRPDASRARRAPGGCRQVWRWQSRCRPVAATPSVVPRSTAPPSRSPPDVPSHRTARPGAQRRAGAARDARRSPGPPTSRTTRNATSSVTAAATGRRRRVTRPQPRRPGQGHRHASPPTPRTARPASQRSSSSTSPDGGSAWVTLCTADHRAVLLLLEHQDRRRRQLRPARPRHRQRRLRHHLRRPSAPPSPTPSWSCSTGPADVVRGHGAADRPRSTTPAR